ncbi:PQQ-binding-like beta-propeller repeat protein, partial [candidate division KSB1 bacterium]
MSFCLDEKKKLIFRAFIFCFIFNLFLYQDIYGSDWPMWRYDASHSAESPYELPSEMNLQWERQYTPRIMVWDDPLNQDIMPYDRVFEPVVMGKTMFIGFNDCDKVAALDTETGEEKWSFYTDGPVRFAPVAWNGSVFFTSDDGYLYCVNAFSGNLNWKFRGGPSERKVLGNKRIISSLPARGGPVFKDGKIYFAASIWPFMGTFIYALDAETGEVVWVNDGTGAKYMLQPHNSPSFAGVAPQGTLVAVGDRLLVSGGRSVPACFNRHTGEFLYYELAGSGKTGGSFVCATEDVFFNHHRERVTTMYDIENGKAVVKSIGKYPVLSKKTYYLSGASITALNSEGIKYNPKKWEESKIWEIKVNASYDLIKAGNRLYAAGEQGITAIDLSGNREEPEIAWTKKVDGQVERLLAADGKLFAVTLDGRIMAFGARKGTPLKNPYRPVMTKLSEQISQKALSILEQTGVKEGYALLYGVSSGDLLEALVRNSDLHITAVDLDPVKVDKLRRRFDKSGLSG